MMATMRVYHAVAVNVNVNVPVIDSHDPTLTNTITSQNLNQTIYHQIRITPLRTVVLATIPTDKKHGYKGITSKTPPWILRN